MEALCRIGMLGGLRVQQGSRTITRFRTQKGAALLAYLAYHLGQAHPREVLTELLWPWNPPAAGRTNLRGELAALRRQLEPPGVPNGTVLQADRFSIRLNPDAVTSDVADLEAALQAASDAGGERERTQGLARAVELYQGPLLPGYYQEWVIPEQERLAELYFQAVGQLVAALEAAGELEAALDYGRRAVAADPLREEARRDLIRLLAAAGQPEAAQRQYEEWERVLKEELGATPPPAARQLMERLLGAKGQEVAARREPPAPVPAPPLRGRRAKPTGTVTFLLTDIEGSTRLAQQAREPFQRALEAHHRLLRQVFRRHGGHEAKELGDGFVVAFGHARNALACAVEGQQALGSRCWPEGVDVLRVRMALHTGDVELKGGEYRGLALHQASRLLTAGHGGQVLCSEVTAGLVRGELEAGVRLRDLGTYRLRDVDGQERLFQLDYPEMALAEFPPLRAEAGYGSHLPMALTRFFGREAELVWLGQTLLGDDTRLVTVTGPGGSGKTRLALETARQLLDPLRGAVWFVALGGISDAELVPGAIAGALNLPRSSQVEPLQQVVDLLCRQPSLLVLDNLEQLVEGTARVVRTLLARAPTLRCLVTSRQRISLDGETELPLAPLDTPGSDEQPQELVRCASVRLFVDRAQAARPDFQVTPVNAPAVAELCQRLEGIPLALELAAAWALVLTPKQMLAQLERRFEFLVSRQRDVDERHRTLRAAVDWSYQLLSPELQRFFARLSAFRGGWTMGTAEVVCDQQGVFEAVLELCDHSLVSSHEEAGGMRYQMLETIREFAAGLLDVEATAALRERHARYFLAAAQGRAAQADGPDEAQAFADLEADLSNLRAAMDWALECGHDQMVVELAAALGDFLWRRGYWQEHAQWTEAGLRAAEDLRPVAPALVARLLHGLARVAHDRGDLQLAESICQRGLALTTETQSLEWQAMLLNLAGLIGLQRGRAKEAGQVLEQSLALFRGIGHRRGEGMALHNLGLLAYTSGQRERARVLYEEALPVRRRAGDVRGAAETQNNLGVLAEEDGRLDAAEAAYREVLRAVLSLEDVLWMAVSLCNLGEMALRTGRPREAAQLLGPAERTLRHLGSVHAPHAAQCLQEALSGVPEAVDTGQLPWRQALIAAAEQASQG